MFYSFSELPVMLNAATISKVLHISMSGVYTMFRLSDFPVIQIGCRKLVARDKFQKWLERHENQMDKDKKTTEEDLSVETQIRA